MRGLRPSAWALLACVAFAGAADSYVTDLARENLTNEGFRRLHEATPADFGIDADLVGIPSDGRLLAGWWMPADPGSANASTTVILVHGHSSQMGKVVRMWAPNLHTAGYSLLAFDLRNHGASPDVAGGLVTYGVTEADDVAAAVDYVRANAGKLGVDPDRIVLYGGSMGGATVLNAASRALPGVVAVISDSAYASFTFQAYADGAEKGYPRFLVDVVLWRMDELAPAPPSSSRPDLAIHKIPVEVLLFHCSDDQRVTHANLDRLGSAPDSAGIAFLPTDATPASDPVRPRVHAWEAPCPTGLSRDHHLDGWMDPHYNATVRHFLWLFSDPASMT